ncbi:thiamine diphosphokinase [Clostridium sp. C105KSO13]|uniref:thiamine diphosphokinase n=1 Tax=Clostridium sp. C105KSO13 TaxID=1776045 RepID=UPI0007407279|nr:thiamine diphosphokinase [Clostridium sp. C105KSO13]CUX39278.1 Thiamine pyrophosphokinase [Clostridium sp. C105KSO13]
MSKRTVIVSGGLLEEEFAAGILRDEDTELIIGVDRGLAFLYEHKILPDYIVGDFDSVPKEIIAYYKEKTKVPVREFNPVKDATDTEIALRLCMDLRRQNICILGGTGTRVDHIWANVQILKIALDAGADARIMDTHNRIRLLKEDFVLKKEEAYGPYFSVFPLAGTVENFNLKGAKYPLSHHELTPFDSLCVSNEIVGDELEISFPFGVVILMETKD